MWVKLGYNVFCLAPLALRSTGWLKEEHKKKKMRSEDFFQYDILTFPSAILWSMKWRPIFSRVKLKYTLTEGIKVTKQPSWTCSLADPTLSECEHRKTILGVWQPGGGVRGTAPFPTSITTPLRFLPEGPDDCWQQVASRLPVTVAYIGTHLWGLCNISNVMCRKHMLKEQFCGCCNSSMKIWTIRKSWMRSGKSPLPEMIVAKIC